jgi:hypothetical protein
MRASSVGGDGDDEQERPNVFASSHNTTPVAPPLSAFGSLARTLSQAPPSRHDSTNQS